MTAYIGTDDRDETDAFDFTVCTPDRLAIWEKEMEGSSGLSVVALRGVLVMERWDFERLRSKIEALCDDARGPDWKLVAAQLNASLR
jgi:Immunity protein 8